MELKDFTGELTNKLFENNATFISFEKSHELLITVQYSCGSTLKYSISFLEISETVFGSATVLRCFRRLSKDMS